ncbi:MAG TPA: nickel-responsive transcriptional regulator NikR [bacterium]|nr:nickel-responsive transcriptional regulator NikR [bacterium]HPN43040.1 nickel-responsive transcriptional regulator NikR [bacterium]
MSTLTRFGISLDTELLEKFDQLIQAKGYANRSEAIRDLIRDTLVQNEWENENQETIGTITIIYDHHVQQISHNKIAKEHKHYHQIISTMHVHLDHENCLEVSAVRGRASEIRQIADEIIGMKGIKHGKLVTTTTGKNLK